MFGTNNPDKAAKTTEQIYKSSLFSDKDRLFAFLDSYSNKSYKKVLQDPAFVVSSDLLDNYLSVVAPAYRNGQSKIDSIQRVYMAGLMEVLPSYKNYYPDANFTLRLSYGKVKGSEPVDGMEYKYYTTMKGIAQKPRY